MKTIYKYKVTRAYSGDYAFNVCLPWDSTLMSVDVQEDDIFLWAMVDDAEPFTDYNKTILIIPTGTPIPPEVESGEYVYHKTLIFPNVRLVFHVFVNKKEWFYES